MSLKKSGTNWFNAVKNAISNNKKQQKAFEEYINAKNKVSVMESIDERPNANLEKEIGAEYCEVKYCPEDSLWGSLYEEDPRTVAVHCNYFWGCKCVNDNCPVLSANHAYIEAKEKYETARKEYEDSVKRIFGIGVKRTMTRSK